MSLTQRAMEFFERRTDARPLAIARIIIGGAAFLRGLGSYHLVHRVLNPSVLRVRPFEWIPDVSREMLPYYISAWLLTSTAFTLGYRTRLSGSILFAFIAYHLAVGQTLFSSHIYFLCHLVLLLTVADAGAAYSIDAHRRRASTRFVPQWGVTLLKLHVSIVYFVASVAKLNPSFLSGEVLGRGLSRPEFIHEPNILVALSWGTVVFEAALAFALWVKPLRVWAIASGTLFHALIPLSMGVYVGLVVFSASVIGTYILFLDRDEFATAEAACRKRLLGIRSWLVGPARTVS